MKGKLHIGTKLILALAMTRQEYNDYRGWELPEDEKHLANENGFLVEYLDGGKANHPDHEGYISWSPEDVFNNAYKASGEMSFGMAIEAAKRGHKIARKGWNGKNMFVVYMEPLYLPPYNTTDTNRKVNDRTAKWIGEDKPLDCQAYFAMYNAQEQWIPGWLASQSDMLADDWVIVE
jgi:hypothetical protein